MTVKFNYGKRNGPTFASLAGHLKQMGYVKLGVIGEEAKEQHEGGISMPALAAVHEYGAPSAGIPERAPIRNSIRTNMPKYRAMVSKMVKRIFKQTMTPERALELLGMAMAADLKMYIRDGHALPANTPEVFLRKLMGTAYGRRRFNKTGKAPVPLVDTAQLLNAYTYAVVPGGKR